MGFLDWLFGKKKKEEDNTAAKEQETVKQPESPRIMMEDYDHAEFDIRGTVLVKHNRQPKKPKVVIPNGVTEIGRQAIDGSTKIKSLTIPASVKVVRSFAIFQSVSPFKELIVEGTDTQFEPNSISLAYGGTVYAVEGSASWNSIVSNKGKYDSYQILPYFPETAENKNNYFVMGKNGIQKAPKATLPKQVTVPSVIDGKKVLDVKKIKGLENVEELEFSEGIESITEISECPKLKRISFPSSLKKIERGCFSGCSELEEVVLNEGLETIGSGCFSYCTSLKKVVIPSTLKEIYIFSAFDGTPWKETLPDPWVCNGVLMRYLNCPEDYALPAEIREIGQCAFYGNKTIRSIRLHKKVERIRTYAFFASALESIDFAGSCPEMDNYAFQKCKNLKKVAISAGTKKIPGHCFSGCDSLADVSLPVGLEEIGWNAFQDCASLNEIKIPKSVNLIGRDAFKGTALKEVTIPEGERGWYKPEDVFPASTDVWKGSERIQKAKTAVDSNEESDGSSGDKGRSSPTNNKEYRLSDTLILSLDRGYYYLEDKTDAGKDEDESEGGISMLAAGTICKGKYKDADSGETKYKNEAIVKLLDAGKDVPIENVGILKGGSYTGSVPNLKFGTLSMSTKILNFTIMSYMFECVKKLDSGHFLDILCTVTSSDSDEAENKIANELDHLLKVLPMFRENGKPLETEKITAKKLWKELQKSEKGDGKKKTKTKKTAVAEPSDLSYSGNIVRVNRELSVEVPDGMVWSTDKNEISSRKLIVFYKDEKNDYYLDVHGEEDYTLNVPYGAPEAFTIQEGISLDGEMDLSEKKTRESVKQLIEDNFSFIVNGELVTFKENNNLMICYQNNENQTQHFIVTPETIYVGQIWINDKENAVPYVESFLSHVKSNQEENIPAEEQPEFVLPTYNEGKTDRAGGLIVPVPDQLLSLSEEKEAELGRIAGEAAEGSFGEMADSLKMLAEHKYAQHEEKFLFLAISKDRNRGFDDYQDAYLSVNIRKDAIERHESLSELWNVGKEAERRAQIKEWISSIVSEEREIHFKKLTDKLEAAYIRANEGEDHGNYWCSYFAVILHHDTVYQVNMFFNAKEDQALFEKTMEEWISRVRVGNAGEADAMMEDIRRTELGPYAGANGKINAVEVSRMFSQDVLFFNDEDLDFNGKHHIVNSFQMNAEKVDDHPRIVEKSARFAAEIRDLLSYLEQNEKLMIPKNRIHEDLLSMTRNDPATGVTFMDFCAWHLMTFAVQDEEKHEYLCFVEPNLIKGIPDAYTYICEFMRTLLAYNGYTGDFTLKTALTVSAELLAERIRNPVVGAAEPESIKVIEVKGIS